MLMCETATLLELPEVIKNLWSAQQALAKHYEDTGLKFTLDGWWAISQKHWLSTTST
jgi:hypothetical protein